VGCLTEDTLIQTSNGPMKLSDLKLKETSLKSFDFENNKEVIGKGAVIPSGNKEVFEIETEDGRKVQATAEHRFFVKRKGKVIELHLKEIKEGDELVCQ
jgi:intein/homing endonuclease